MNNIIQAMNEWFVHGTTKGITTILLVIFSAFLFNHAANSFIQKKWQNNTIMPKRIKRIILSIYILYGILTQITPLKSLATTLLASGGIIAVIVGLASQEAATNIISGMMIYFGKPFKTGDWIIVKDVNLRGKVLDISLRHTIMETLEKTQVIIPNTTMNKAIIENISNIATQKANHLFIDISYESDIDKAINIIIEEVSKHPYFIKQDKNPAVPVHCIDFKDSGISLRATVYSRDNEQGFEILSDLRISIKQRFDKEGIEIPYPHRTIIQKNSI